MGVCKTRDKHEIKLRRIYWVVVKDRSPGGRQRYELWKAKCSEVPSKRYGPIYRFDPVTKIGYSVSNMLMEPPIG